MRGPKSKTRAVLARGKEAHAAPPREGGRASPPLIDLVIVGGGPAGLSTALHLAAHAPAFAARTIVLERATYPRDKPCAGAIGARAIDVLARIGVDLGLGERLPAARIDAFSVALGGGSVRVHEPAAAWIVRRLELDAALASTASARGVRVREGARVIGVSLDREGEHARVRLELEGAPPLFARAVVGADGVTGITRRAIGLPRASFHAQAAEVDTERVAGDLPEDELRFELRPELRGYLWDFPTPLGGRVMMSRGVYLLRDRRDARADVRAVLAAHLARRGLSLGAHDIKQLAEQGWAPQAAISAPRVILVGEAAGIDFPTGEGIAQAIAHGAVAAPYLAAALARDRCDFGDWREVLLAADEGRFLARRHLGGRLLFGRARPAIERALVRSPSVFQVALQRFAGRAPSRRLLARAALELAPALLREALRAATSARS